MRSVQSLSASRISAFALRVKPSTSASCLRLDRPSCSSSRAARSSLRSVRASAFPPRRAFPRAHLRDCDVVRSVLDTYARPDLNRQPRGVNPRADLCPTCVTCSVVLLGARRRGGVRTAGFELATCPRRAALPLSFARGGRCEIARGLRPPIQLCAPCGPRPGPRRHVDTCAIPLAVEWDQVNSPNSILADALRGGKCPRPRGPRRTPRRSA